MTLWDIYLCVIAFRNWILNQTKQTPPALLEEDIGRFVNAHWGLEDHTTHMRNGKGLGSLPMAPFLFGSIFSFAGQAIAWTSGDNDLQSTMRKLTLLTTNTGCKHVFSKNLHNEGLWSRVALFHGKLLNRGVGLDPLLYTWMDGVCYCILHHWRLCLLYSIHGIPSNKISLHRL